MSAPDRPQFGRGERAAQTRPLWLMILILLATTGAFAAWSRRQAAAPEPLIIVEVRGAVPAPGHHALRGQATVHGALRAAGLQQPTGPDAVIDAGTRLRLEDDGAVRIERMDDLVVVGLPVDVNHASVEALATVPGLRRPVAEAIVARRAERGPFTDLSELVEVKGIGPATLKELRPFLALQP